MYRKPSRKKELRRRIVTYSAMTMLVGVLVTMLTLIILGYRVENGQIERRALLQVASSPSGATVFMDDKVLGGKTPSKYSVPEGTHTFVFKKEGYETWKKTIDVQVDTLTWLNYVRLVPLDKTVEYLDNFVKINSSMSSPDGKKMLVQEDGSKPIYKILDLRGDDIKSTTLTIDSSLYSVPKPDTKHVFIADRWDSSGRYLLVKHVYDSQYEWLVIDTQDSTKNKNITKLLDVNITKAEFSGTNGNIIYALIDGDIRKLDLSADTISRSLATKVKEFKLYNTSTIVYVGSDTTGKKSVIGLYRDGDDTPHILRTVDKPDVPLKVTTTRYYNQDYIAIAQNGQVDLLVGSYPSVGINDDSSMIELRKFNLTSDVTSLDFSQDGDYMLAQSADGYLSYDIGYDRVVQDSFDTVVADTSTPRFKWLDDSHLWSDVNGQLTMYDFDGTNKVAINTMSSGKAVLLSANEKFIYSIGIKDSGFALQRIKL